MSVIKCSRKVTYSGGACNLPRISPSVSRAMLNSTKQQNWGKEAFILPNGHIGIIGLPPQNPVTVIVEKYGAQFCVPDISLLDDPNYPQAITLE